MCARLTQAHGSRGNNASQDTETTPLYGVMYNPRRTQESPQEVPARKGGPRVRQKRKEIMPKQKGAQINIIKGGEYSHSRPYRKRAVDVFTGVGGKLGTAAKKARQRRDKIEGSAQGEEYMRGHYKRGGT